MTKCWLRAADDGREAAHGFSSGAKTCQPPDTQVLTRGNSECWNQGFDYSTCCDVKFGREGNAECWDDEFNYGKCCFPVGDEIYHKFYS